VLRQLKDDLYELVTGSCARSDLPHGDSMPDSTPDVAPPPAAHRTADTVGQYSITKAPPERLLDRLEISEGVIRPRSQHRVPTAPSIGDQRA